MSGINPQIIPVRAVASQMLNTVVNSQNVRLNIYAKTISVPVVPTGGIPTDPPVYERINPVFMDVYLNDNILVYGVLCRNDNVIVRNLYFGLSGDFAWTDTQGSDDPQYQGLGTRWLLVYYPPTVPVDS